MKQKTVKFGKVKIKLLETPETVRMQFNFGRCKKDRKINTWTIYDAISEKHKPIGDEIWLDLQNRKAIGMMVTLDKV